MIMGSIVSIFVMQFVCMHVHAAYLLPTLKNLIISKLRIPFAFGALFGIKVYRLKPILCNSCVILKSKLIFINILFNEAPLAADGITGPG